MRLLFLFVLSVMLITISCQSKGKGRNEKPAELILSDSAKKTIGKDSADAFMDDDYKVDPEDQAYYDFRIVLTIPPYGLGKVRTLADKASLDDDNAGETEAISAGAYDSLSFREKFTYHMIHPESYSQICDFIPPPQKAKEKIFGHLPDLYSDYNWSSRQKAFLKDNRDSVMALIQESVPASKSKRVGLNYKEAIEVINGKEMIPWLIDAYNTDRKDTDILTLLLLMMRENKYPPFVSSPHYKKLYGDESGYETFIDLSPANRDLIIKLATDFYHAGGK